LTAFSSGRLRSRVDCALVLAAAVYYAACSAATPGGRRFPEFVEFAGQEVSRVEFEGNEPISSDTLALVVQTERSHCALLGLPLCLPFTKIGQHKHQLSLETLSRDVSRIALFFRRAGYFGTQVRPTVVRDDDKVAVTFMIQRGRAVHLDSLKVFGLDSLMNADSLVATLPLRKSELFDLAKFNTSADRVQQALLATGHAYSRVLRNFAVDTVNGHAYAELEAIPGPVVRVDSIIVSGAEHLGRGAALQQLTFGVGDLLDAKRLVDSQRNLYGLELVQFATVQVAPDSLQRQPVDSTRATVLAEVVEAPVHQVEAAVGFGTIECFRSEARWVSRSFGGGARRLGVTGSVAKLGTGTGLGTNACGAFEQDTFRRSLDYRFAADLTQPYFRSPRNHLSLSGFVERQSEPTVFQRTAQGGRFAIAHRLQQRTIATVSLNFEHGTTIAKPALFCIAFQSCVPELVEDLANPRWRNSIGASLVRDHTDQALDPSNGYVARLSSAWSNRFLGTSTSFVRTTGEGAYYREFHPSWVLAASVRFGTFFRTAGLEGTNRFLSPEERFYAGGANSVRGYDRNSLGPVLYLVAAGDSVSFDADGTPHVWERGSADGETPPKETQPQLIPVGGTAMTVANIELRLPSPLLSDYLRLAAFVDGGAVGTGNLWNLGGRGWKVTPGVGLRIATPVGPVRMDMAYSAYGPAFGPLYVEEEGTRALTRVSERYRGDAGSVLSRLHFHLAVGQAF
jgi:outer membrane protein insertion porin family